MNKIKLLLTPFMLVPFLFSCSSEEPSTFSATCTDENVELSETKVNPGNDFIAALTIKSGVTGKQFPEKLTKVKSGGEEVPEQSSEESEGGNQGFNYYVDSPTEATLRISASYIKGDVVIELQLTSITSSLLG